MVSSMRSEKEEGCQEVQGVCDDGIDVGHLVMVLVRRKVIIVGFLLLCFAGGLVFSLSKPIVYKYSSTIDVSSISGEKVIDPGKALSMLQETYIPLALASAQLKTGTFPTGVNVARGKDSPLIILSSYGEIGAADRITKLHSSVLEPLREESEAAADVARKKVSIKLVAAKLKLKELEDPRVYAIAENSLLIDVKQAKLLLLESSAQDKYLQAREQQLLLVQGFLRQQIMEAEQRLVEAHKSRSRIISEVADSKEPLAMLVQENQIQQGIQQENMRLSTLKERLEIEVENQKSKLAKEKDDLKRKRDLRQLSIDKSESQILKFKLESEKRQQIQKNIITAFETQLNQIMGIRVLSLATRAVQPVASGKTKVIVFSSVGGLMGGIVLAFIAEFISVIRWRIRQENEYAK